MDRTLIERPNGAPAPGGHHAAAGAGGRLPSPSRTAHHDAGAHPHGNDGGRTAPSFHGAGRGEGGSREDGGGGGAAERQDADGAASADKQSAAAPAGELSSSSPTGGAARPPPPPHEQKSTAHFRRLADFVSEDPRCYSPAEIRDVLSSESTCSRAVRVAAVSVTARRERSVWEMGSVVGGRSRGHEGDPPQEVQTG